MNGLTEGTFVAADKELCKGPGCTPDPNTRSASRTGRAPGPFHFAFRATHYFYPAQSTKGLTVSCRLDRRRYTIGRKVTDQEMALVRIKRNKFHGEWNYEIHPSSKS